MTSLEQAAADARAALKLARQIGYTAGEAVSLAELSLISCYADDGDQAVEWARQAQRISQDQMPGWSVRKVEIVLPWALVISGHLDGALDFSVQLLEHARAAGDVTYQSDALYVMAVLARRAGRLTEAGAHLRKTAELAMYAGFRLRLIDVLDEGGFWCAAAGQYAAAVALWSARHAQNQAAGLTDTPEEERTRERPLREAMQVLDAGQVRAAEARGAAMTLAAAVEFTVMMTGQNTQRPTAPSGIGEAQLTRTRADHPGRPGADRRPDRRQALHQRQHRPHPPGPHPRQEWIPPPRRPDSPGSGRRHHLATLPAATVEPDRPVTTPGGIPSAQVMLGQPAGTAGSDQRGDGRSLVSGPVRPRADRAHADVWLPCDLRVRMALDYQAASSQSCPPGRDRYGRCRGGL